MSQSRPLRARPCVSEPRCPPPMSVRGARVMMSAMTSDASGTGTREGTNTRWEFSRFPKSVSRPGPTSSRWGGGCGCGLAGETYYIVRSHSFALGQQQHLERWCTEDLQGHAMHYFGKAGHYFGKAGHFFRGERPPLYARACTRWCTRAEERLAVDPGALEKDIDLGDLACRGSSCVLTKIKSHRTAMASQERAKQPALMEH
jgi:hypothetical protein